MTDESLINILVFLTLLLILFSFLATIDFSKPLLYKVTLLTLCIFLLVTFKINNFLIFYIFFESSLIPTLFLILLWGYQPERLQAGRYMILYTVGASLPLLLTILFLYFKTFTLHYFIFYTLCYKSTVMLILGLSAAFLVKVPIYGFHLWLPKAHVEAPLRGSMLLAGILLKLGGYGLYILNKILIFTHLKTLCINLRVWSLVGGLFSTLLCLRQTDVKALVAYSSISHIRLVVAGLILGTRWGLFRAKVTILAHGLSSSALFILVSLMYKKVKSRRLIFIGGLLSLYPKISFFWFLFRVLNIAAPPSLNLVGEISILPVLYQYSYLLVVLVGCIIFITAAYNIFLYTSINHGSSNSLITPSSSYTRLDYLLLCLHLFPYFLLVKLEFLL